MRAAHWITAFLLVPQALRAQGVSTASLEGRIISQDGASIARAVVVVTHTPSGARWQTITRGNGRYALEHLVVGGPYVIEARALGFQPVRVSARSLALGERASFDLTMSRTALALDRVVIRTTDASHGAGSGGPATAIRDSVISALPIRGRDVFQIALLSPHAARTTSGTLSIAGQPDRLNALQIDGATNNDLLGNSNLGLVGTPGQSLGVRTLSPEAVKELQVVVAPFDVRFGNFAGGLINAVTRTGGNQFEGSAATWYSGGSLVGRDDEGERGTEFSTRELTLTVSGPIVHDRAGMFVAGTLRREVLPQNVPLIGQDSSGTGITRESVARLQDILAQRYNVEAGSSESFPLAGTPANVFAKITAQPGVNNLVELSHNYSHNTPDILTFVPLFGCRFRGVYCLSSRSFRLPISINTTRLGWTSVLRSGFENELIVARMHERQQCESSSYPGLAVSVDRGLLLAGRADFCTDDSLIENIIEATDNLTMTVSDHRFTLGAHVERIALPRTDGVQNRFRSNWIFSSLDSLASGLPSRYTITYRNPVSGDDALSDAGTNQLGFYVQDQWSVTRRLTVTAGLRFDAPYARHNPDRNEALLGALGIDNSLTPSGNVLWSPRIGWEYVTSTDRRGVFRGGIGVFAGRPPYKWLDQVYSHTGLETLTLTCSGSSVPSFTLDLSRQPQTCGKPATPVASFIDLFDPAFRFPRNLKLSGGFERVLAQGTTVGADVVVTKALNQFDLRDVNLVKVGAAAGEGGRALYGTVGTSNGRAISSRHSAQFGSVFQVRNNSGDRTLSIAAQARRKFGDVSELSIFYSYLESRDRFSAVEDAADASFGMVPIDGSIENRRLANSAWSLPHRIGVTWLVQAPAQIHFALSYNGTSGAPFTYVISGDANADGYGDAADARELFNDAIYVPASVSDISLADPAEYSELEKVIDGDACLRKSRGRILERNSCRNPWVSVLNARASKVFALWPRRSVEIIADVFNVFSLLGWKIGEIKEISGGSSVALLALTGYDTAHERGIYRLIPVELTPISNDVSRWRIQLGARLNF